MASDFISLSDARQFFPRVNGKRPHVDSLRRWGTKGIRGAKLGIQRIGGRWYTTREAISQFFLDCQKTSGTELTRTIPRRTKRETDRMKRELAAEGYYGAQAKKDLLGVQKKR